MKTITLMKYILHLCVTCILFQYSNALTWNQLMETAKYGTSEISDILEPYIVENFPTANVSKQCINSLLLYAEGIKNFEPWAVKMFDATGKPPSSILRGTYSDFGSFDECLSLEVDTNGHSSLFKGQFCMLSLRTPLFPTTVLKKGEKESYINIHGYPPEWAIQTTKLFENDWPQFFGSYLGICIPSTCSERDLTNIISAYAKTAELQVSLSDCQVNEPTKWPTSGKVAIFATAFLILIIILGTIFDFYERKRKPYNLSCHEEGTKQKVLKTFSVISNWEILVKKQITNNSLDFLNGMKFYLVVWTLIMHLFAIETLWEFKRHRNLNHFTRIRGASTVIFENSLPITTYITFLNGFFTSYTSRNKQPKARQPKVKRNNGLVKLFFIRYLRLMPSVIFLMVMTFVIPMTYNGPIWNSTWNHVQNNCLKNGWANLLIVSNFLDYRSHCWVHMWFYSTIVQFQIIGLPLLVLAKRHPKFTFIIGILISIGCGVRDFVVSIQNEFNFPSIPAMHSGLYFCQFLSKIYLKPYNHFSSFAIGMIFGWINLKAFKMNKIFLFIGWFFYTLLSLALFYVIMYPTQNLILTASHNAFRGVFFSLQMGWLIYTCFNKTAGILGGIFSWKALLPFGKLLNSVFMFHPLLIVTYEAMRKERLYTSELSYIQLHFALIVCSFLISVIGFLVVESPFNRLCDLWEGKSYATSQKNTDTYSGNNFAVYRNNVQVSENGKRKNG